MPIHDWTCVGAGIFHHFQHSWIEEIAGALNAGLLPAPFYALAEQFAGAIGPDVLTLQIDAPAEEQANGFSPSDNTGGMIAVAKAPPKVRFTAQTEMDQYAQKQNSLVIRHSSGDEVVALVEIVSPGNKSNRHALRALVEKAAAALYRGYHLLVLDLQLLGPRDPQGIHGAIWEEIADDTYRQPADKPLTLVAYDAGPPKLAYVEPVAVGDTLPEMPLFLQPGQYVSVPLQRTYDAAWQRVPQRWRTVLERFFVG